jgi:hypothetical protein
MCYAFIYLLFVLSSSLNVQQVAVCLSKSDNIFDNMAALATPKSIELHDELNCYLSSDPEHIVDAVSWWYGHHAEYPCLVLLLLEPGLTGVFS